MSIRDILRHHHDLGLPRAEIAVAVSVSAGTVSNVLERAQAAGLSWPLPSDLDDDGLRARLYPPAPRESGYAQPDWDDVLRELRAKRKRRRVRATRRTLWEEYRAETRARGGKAYSYSQFCARLKAHQGSCGGSAQMHFDYEPGLYGMADFSGKTLALRTGRTETDVEIFVAVLAHSNLIYAEAVSDQTVRHWTMAHRRALEYFGGTPRRWIIDNLKSGVDDPDRDDIRLNPSYREFALHYGIAVLPARQYRATDKGLVESCVKAVQTRILLALRHHTFFSLDTMNAAIRRELDRLNEAPMAKHGESRRALFRGERAGGPGRSTGAPLGVGRVDRAQGRAELSRPPRAQSLLRAGALYRPPGRRPRRRTHGRGVPRTRRRAHRRPPPQGRAQPVRHHLRAHAGEPPGGLRYPPPPTTATSCSARRAASEPMPWPGQSDATPRGTSPSRPSPP